MSRTVLSRFRAASRSETGWRRRSNQDRLLVRALPADALLLAVADGMGGQAGGEIAAQIAVDTLARLDRGTPDPTAILVRLMHQANQRVLAEAERRPELQGMGSTLTAALLENGHLSWGHVGDSRLYLHRRGELRQITTDQNAAWRLVEAGQLSEKAARVSPYRRLLDQCVGCRSFQPACGALEIRAGDWLLLSTDGLHGELPASELAGILAGAERSSEAVRSLIQACLDRGGNDNITVIAVELRN